MPPPVLDFEGKIECNVSMMASSVLTDCSNNGSTLKERNYMGLSDCSSVDSSIFSALPEENRNCLNLKATELRLGLPGSQSPDRGSDFTPLGSSLLDEKQLFPLISSKEGTCLSSQKAAVIGFSDTVEGFQDSKDFTLSEVVKTPKDCSDNMNGSKADNVPAAKAQVVGWPPIRSYRKNALATNSKNNEEANGKTGPGAHFVKVSMDGAPYLRKVDLRMCASYRELSTSLEKMFSCFTLGQCGAQGSVSREILSETKWRDLLHGSEYVLTYEDKDGDWMLVGDVPWKMFIESCRRLKIMKGSDAIGLAPRAAEKSKNRNWRFYCGWFAS